METTVLTEQRKIAIELNQKIIITAQLAQQNLYEMCCLLKKMRDEKLYKELGYQNFEDYCENEVGMKRRNAYNYIAVIERIENVQSIAQIGMTKLSLLASLSESQQEEVQQNVNVENVSVRELKAEIAKLKADKTTVESNLKILKKGYDTLQQELQQEKEKSDKAQERIDELESRPIEVAVEEDVVARKENTRLKTQLAETEEKLKEMENSGSADLKIANATIRRLDAALSEANQNHVNAMENQRKEYQEKINQLEEQLEQQKNNLKAVEKVEVPDMAEVFKVYYKNSVESFKAMLNFIDSLEDRTAFVEKTENLIETLQKLLENMKGDIFDV